MNDIGILNNFEGISLHDRWSSYDKFECTHGLCNAHLLRDLKFLNEEMESIWAIQMISLLVRANNYKKQGIVDESIV
jgi:transposase